MNFCVVVIICILMLIIVCLDVFKFGNYSDRGSAFTNGKSIPSQTQHI